MHESVRTPARLAVETRLLLGALALLGLLSWSVARAAPPQVSIGDARIRLLPGDLPLAGYFTLTNTGDAPVTLTGADSPAFAGVHLHRSVQANGVQSMTMVPGLTVAPHQSLRFEPGGYHLMLMGRRQTLTVGDRVPVALRFETGDALEVEFSVGAADSQ